MKKNLVLPHNLLKYVATATKTNTKTNIKLNLTRTRTPQRWDTKNSIFIESKVLIFFCSTKNVILTNMKKKICSQSFNIKSVIDWKPKEIEANELRRKKEGREREKKSTTTVHVELFCQYTKILYQIHFENWTQRKNFILNWSPRLWTFAHGGVQEKSSFICT